MAICGILFAGCAPPPAAPPAALPRLAREAPPRTTPAHLAPDAGINTTRVLGTSPAIDFTALHAAHTEALARAHGAPLDNIARLQLPNALDYHGSFYTLGAVELLVATDPTRLRSDFDPHATAKPAVRAPNTAEVALLESHAPGLKKDGTTLHGVAMLDPTAPACTQCHTGSTAGAGKLLYTFRELADD